MRAHRKNAIDWLERSNVVHSVSMWHCTGCRVRKQRVDDACSKASSSSFSSSSPSLKLAVSYQPSSTPPSGTIPSIILNPTHTPQIFQAFAQQRPASAACRCPQHLGAISHHPPLAPSQNCQKWSPRSQCETVRSNKDHSMGQVATCLFQAGDRGLCHGWWAMEMTDYAQFEDLISMTTCSFQITSRCPKPVQSF